MTLSSCFLVRTAFIIRSGGSYCACMVVADKRQLYEEDVRVPLLVRGPGISGGQVLHEPAAHIDLAPTILDMMGLPVAEQMDGRSVACMHGFN